MRVPLWLAMVLLMAMMAGCCQAPVATVAAAPVSRDASDSLAHYRAALAGKEPFTIVALGDSMTEVNWTSRGHLNWVGLMQASLFESGAAKRATVINAGVSGSTFTDALARFDRDVARHDPDLVIVGFGINDWMFSKIPLEQQRRDLEALVARLRTDTRASILLRTPPLIADKDTFAWADPEPLRDTVAMIREVAAEQAVALVDHQALWRAAPPPDARAVMYDWIHPNELGQRRLFEELAPVLGLKTELRWMKAAP